MKCKSCGAEFPEGIFCPECGTKNEIKNTLATVSLVAGILSIVTLGCWIIPEIVAIVCGISSKKNGETKAAKAGIICGIIGSILFLLIVIYAISVNISNEPASTGVKPTEAIVTTEEVAEANTTNESTTEEESKDKNDLSQYYGKSISELQDSTGMEMEKDGNAYYAGTLFLNTDNNDKIISMSMTFNSTVGEGVLNFEGITANDTIKDAANKLESAGYKLEKDSVYKGKNNMMVLLSDISEEEFYLQYISEEEYATQENKEQESDDTPEEYYVTDTAWGNTIRTHVEYAYTENSWGSNMVRVECEITNITDDSITFDASDYYKLDNNGVAVNVNGTDYDYKEIAAGYSFKATLSFTCPENSNTDLSLMTMTADNLEFNLGDKPQSDEEMKGFAGTYSRHDGSSRIMVSDNGDETYNVQEIVAIGDETMIDKYTNVTLDENNMFYLNRGCYLWSPDEYAIYSYDTTWDKIDENQTPWVKK